jgi:DNA-binding IclR family transcriptional regulator
MSRGGGSVAVSARPGAPSGKRPRKRGRRAPVMVNALRRGLEVLETIAEAGGRLPLKPIAERVGLHLSTAHHLVRTLEALGYVEQSEGKAYRLRRRVFQLAAAAWNDDELAQLAGPVVRELGLKTGETAQFAVFDRRLAVVLAKFDATGPWRLYDRVGAERPAYCTAIGKAQLAFQKPPILREYLEAVELRAFTANTITSASRLQRELQRIAKRGVAVDDEEFSMGVRCLAVPIFNFTGTVVAAVGLFGATWRVTPDRMADLVGTLREMGERLCRELAYIGPYPPASDRDDRPLRPIGARR